jgi:diaminohydroxyphosphoribosylaminopyrimidine deaminase / 5-amino-6-(5-phosphoribosylamino)uracil reductase
VADVVPVGDGDAGDLDLRLAFAELRAMDVTSVLCEGGPTIAASALRDGVVDKFYWSIAPRLLANAFAVPALRGADLSQSTRVVRFDPPRQLGDDVLLSGTFTDV